MDLYFIHHQIADFLIVLLGFGCILLSFQHVVKLGKGEFHRVLFGSQLLKEAVDFIFGKSVYQLKIDDAGIQDIKGFISGMM